MRSVNETILLHVFRAHMCVRARRMWYILKLKCHLRDYRYLFCTKMICARGATRRRHAKIICILIYDGESRYYFTWLLLCTSDIQWRRSQNFIAHRRIIIAQNINYFPIRLSRFKTVRVNDMEGTIKKLPLIL